MTRFDYTKPLDGDERIVETADGAKLRTVSMGSGDRPVLLAHGYASGADAWNVMAPTLAGAGMRVVVFDQRGHGRSTIGSDGVSTAVMASDYGAILDAYELENATLVGHSMGGFLAIAFLLDGDETARARVGALVLAGTFAGDVSRNNSQNKLQIPLIKSGVLQRLLGFGPIATAFTKSLTGDAFESGMVDAFIPIFQAADHGNLIPILQAMVDENRYDRLGELDLPCTVIVGAQDATTPPFHTADLHSGIAGSKLVTLERVGHGINWEAPDEVNVEIRELADRTAEAA